jgi:hypothetical protein
LHAQKRLLAWIVLVGGVIVLTSYAYSLGIDASTRADLWGGVPPEIGPAYVVSMVLAAAGYFAFTFFLFFRVDPDETRIAGRFRFNLFSGLYTLILGPSALWLPLTSAMIQRPSSVLWLGVRLVLGMVGLGSIGLLLSLLRLQPRQRSRVYWLAVAGSAAFSIHTVVLDLIIWTALFPT